MVGARSTESASPTGAGGSTQCPSLRPSPLPTRSAARSGLARRAVRSRRRRRGACRGLAAARGVAEPRRRGGCPPPAVRLGEADRAGAVVRLVVSRALALATRDRLAYWRTLEELAGVRNEHVLAAVKSARSEGAARAAHEREELAARHLHELESFRATADERAVDRLISALFEITRRPGGPAAAIAVTRSTGPVAPAAVAPSAVAPVAASATLAGPAPSAVEEAWVDSALCTSCDECIRKAPGIFAYNAEQRLVKDPRGGTFRDLVQAAEACTAKIIHPAHRGIRRSPSSSVCANAPAPSPECREWKACSSRRRYWAGSACSSGGFWPWPIASSKSRRIRGSSRWSVSSPARTAAPAASPAAAASRSASSPEPASRCTVSSPAGLESIAAFPRRRRGDQAGGPHPLRRRPGPRPDARQLRGRSQLSRRAPGGRRRARMLVGLPGTRRLRPRLHLRRDVDERLAPAGRRRRQVHRLRRLRRRLPARPDRPRAAGPSADGAVPRPARRGSGASRSAVPPATPVAGAPPTPLRAWCAWSATCR